MYYGVKIISPRDLSREDTSMNGKTLKKTRFKPLFRPPFSFFAYKKNLPKGGLFNGAGEGIRTLDINLGKVALYP